MKRGLAACAVAVMLVGCSAPGVEPVPPSEPPSTSAAPIPDDGTSLRDLGFTHAPEGVSLPSGVIMNERIDQANNVTAVITAPSGAELAGYLRRSLPEQGFDITADNNNSLLFERGEWQGAFTTEAGLSALSLRTDRED